MKISQNNFFTTSDGAHIYYEDRGKGTPLIMVPGFLCTTKFFEKNAEVLSNDYRVITIDPRGQGFSSKTTIGNTIKRHAKDIKELIEYLNLENVVLLGWSLAASVVVSYAADFDQYRLLGLVIMDGSLFPFSSDEWNHHRGKDYNIDNWMETYMPLYYDPQVFYDKFVARISKDGNMDEKDRLWIISECKKTMPWSAIELHYDFCHTNNVKNLNKITVPFAVFGAQSKAYGLEMTEKFAKEVKGYSEINKFYNSGHLMFIYEAEKFNNCLKNFIKKAENLKNKP